MIKVLLVSGPICSGKSEFAEQLGTRISEEYMTNVGVLSTSLYLERLLKNEGYAITREAKQQLGKKLDDQTSGGWVAELVKEAVSCGNTLVIVDSVRDERQINAIKNLPYEVRSVYLTASEEILQERWDARGDAGNIQEATANDPAPIGGYLVLDSGKTSVEGLITIAMGYLKYNPRHNANVDVLVGGQYGSEGKGHIASFLANEYDVLVRSGGPNAGHQVRMDDGSVYCYHHLPSGTMHNKRALIILGPGAVINWEMLKKEIKDSDCESRLCIDRNAFLITGEDIQFEKEALEGKIGSTAQGVGHASARKMLRGSYGTITPITTCAEAKEFIGDTREVIERCLQREQRVFVEGTQGTGLSLHHTDCYPYGTSRDTSVSGLISEVGISPRDVRHIIMVCRTYPIRVQSPKDGTSGNMTEEVDWGVVAAASGHVEEDLKERELTSTTKKQRRVSEFDWGLLRRSAILNRPTDIALTFCDYLDKANEHKAFTDLTVETRQFIRAVECAASAPVSMLSTAFDKAGIIDRRWWSMRNTFDEMF